MAFKRDKNTHARVIIDGKELIVRVVDVKKIGNGFEVNILEEEEIHDEEARADVEDLIARWTSVGKAVAAQRLEEIGLWKIFVETKKHTRTVAVAANDVEFFSPSSLKSKYTEMSLPSGFIRSTVTSSTGFTVNSMATEERTLTGRVRSAPDFQQMPRERFTRDEAIRDVEQLQAQLSQLREAQLEDGPPIQLRHDEAAARRIANDMVTFDPTPAEDDPMRDF